MKKGSLPGGHEAYIFGETNKLKVFALGTFNFKPKSHIKINDTQRCILDNFWFQYTNKREDQGYMLAILDSLAEYFNELNQGTPKAPPKEMQKEKAIYNI